MWWTVTRLYNPKSCGENFDTMVLCESNKLKSTTDHKVARMSGSNRV